MKRIQLFLTLVAIFCTHLLEAQLEGNVRSTFEAVNRQCSTPGQRMPEQDRKYTNVLDVPEQEELIKKFRVKTMKKLFDDGDWNLDYYDERGLLIKREKFAYGEMNVDTHEYLLDSNGNVLMDRIKDNDTLRSTRYYAYDEHNRLIVEGFKYKDEEMTFKNRYYNDELGIVIEVDEYGMERTFLDSQGSYVKLESFDELGKLVGSARAEFNERGLKIREHSNAMGIKIVDEYTHNERGQELFVTRETLIHVEWEYQYNDYGLEIYKWLKNHLGETTDTIEYTYY